MTNCIEGPAGYGNSLWKIVAAPMLTRAISDDPKGNVAPPHQEHAIVQKKKFLAASPRKKKAGMKSGMPGFVLWRLAPGPG
jgi:hypothetical protein